MYCFIHHADEQTTLLQIDQVFFDPFAIQGQRGRRAYASWSGSHILDPLTAP